ncbi:MAG: 50S ribosomal protein L13 [Candidatus Latescibacterota bacterium]|mgnify:CR=1 FL=1|nr:MAG: 50S ribosomal protein L13 [Candidatus Latescibacterota bacterium]RKY73291.1 MAG: 50S ribosomal protein L13 [Candidatus Latescibacterota bacterium]
MDTYVVKQEDIQRKWYLVDAQGQVLGRLATKVAQILRGKHKVLYSPHLDVGDHVIVINADKIRVTGKKYAQKRYYYHTGYPGGLRSVSFSKLLSEKPVRVLEKTVKGMLPHNKLGKKMFRKLRVYAGPEHSHQAQQPELLEL